MTCVPLPAKTSSNAAANLASRSRIRNLKRGRLAEVHEQVAGLLGRPWPGWVGGDAEDMYGPGLDLHREEDVQAPEEDGVCVQEVACQDPGGLRSEELPPGW
jgi:hypothetical protein